MDERARPLARITRVGHWLGIRTLLWDGKRKCQKKEKSVPALPSKEEAKEHGGGGALEREREREKERSARARVCVVCEGLLLVASDGTLRVLPRLKGEEVWSWQSSYARAKDKEFNVEHSSSKEKESHIAVLKSHRRSRPKRWRHDPSAAARGR